MKRSLKFIFFLFLFLCSTAYSDTELEFTDISNEELVTEEKDQGPFQVEFITDFIEKAQIDKKRFRCQHFTYQDSHINAGAVFYYNRCCKEGLRLALSYDFTRLVWHRNPYFHRKNFYTFSFGLQAFTHRVYRWLWQAQFMINLDTRHMNNPSHYANYDFLLWGRYDYCSNIGVHAGILAQTGMKIDRVYPIIGFDWQVDPKLKLNVVYPVNLSMIYNITPDWTASIAGRVFNRRQRVGRDEPLSRGLWAYRANGIEAATSYFLNSWLKFNVHVGHTFGTKLTVADRHYRHKHHIRIKGSRYVGGEVAANF